MSGKKKDKRVEKSNAHVTFVHTHEQTFETSDFSYHPPRFDNRKKGKKKC